ncbi:MAG: MFS transporter [Eubacteriaceae bacterium]
MSNKKRELTYVICLTSFITITFAFGRYIFAMITPEIVMSLNLDYEFIGRINAVHQGAYLLFSLLGGVLCSYVSVRFLITGSVLLCGISVLLLGFVNNPWVILVVVGLQGIFAALSWIPMVEFVSENIGEQNRGKSLGIIASGTSFGLIINGFLIPKILMNESWQSVWIIFGIISIVLGLIGTCWIYYLKRDNSGIILVGNKESLEIERSVVSTKVENLVGKKKSYFFLIILLIVSGLYLIPFQSYIVPLMKEDFGLSKEISGLAWSIFGFVGIFSGFIAGVLADRFSAKKAMVMTYGISVISIGAIVFFQNSVGVLFACFVFGLAYNGIFGLHPTYVSRVLPPEKTAKFFGLLNLSLGLGSMIGNYLGGYFQKITGNFGLTYQLMLVLGLVAVVLCLGIRDDRNKCTK